MRSATQFKTLLVSGAQLGHGAVSADPLRPLREPLSALEKGRILVPARGPLMPRRRGHFAAPEGRGERGQSDSTSGVRTFLRTPVRTSMRVDVFACLRKPHNTLRRVCDYAHAFTGRVPVAIGGYGDLPPGRRDEPSMGGGGGKAELRLRRREAILLVVSGHRLGLACPVRGTRSVDAGR